MVVLENRSAVSVKDLLIFFRNFGQLDEQNITFYRYMGNPACACVGGLLYLFRETVRGTRESTDRWIG